MVKTRTKKRETYPHIIYSRVTESTWEKLTDYADRLDITPAQILRKLVEEFVEKHWRKK